jgi:hypothetical protein
MEKVPQLLGLIEADLFDGQMPAPAFSFQEWQQIAAELKRLVPAGHQRNGAALVKVRRMARGRR